MHLMQTQYIPGEMLRPVVAPRVFTAKDPILSVATLVNQLLSNRLTDDSTMLQNCEREPEYTNSQRFIGPLTAEVKNEATSST